MKITKKDWERMLDLVMAGECGVSIAHKLKNKEKAAARFICGCKLDGDQELILGVPYKPNAITYQYSAHTFYEFGNKALELGATHEELLELFTNTHIPKEFEEKKKELASKKLDNRFVSCVTKAVLKAGWNIEYLPHNGYAITQAGSDAMARNGRKWTIGYKTVLHTPNGMKCNFTFDAITDEGDGPTRYIVDHNGTHPMFDDMCGWESKGKNQFIKELTEIIKR